MSQKIFITGATGFVGRHLIRLLSLENYQIYGTAYPEMPEEDEFEGNPHLFHIDIRSEEDLTSVIKDVVPDRIFHLAALSNVGHSWEKRTETMESNLMGTFYVFESVRQFAPKAKILFVSSSDVYGILEPVEEALSEEVDPKIVSPYAFTKVCGEQLSRFYSEIEGLDVVVSRPFPHTGPGQSADFVCSDWAFQIAKIEKGLMEPVVRVGSLEVRRDISDVRDVVKAYISLLEKGKTGEIYNVCSGRAVVLKDILNLLLSFSSKKIEVKVDPNRKRKADIPLLLGNNEKIRNELNWTPEIPLDQTLKELLNYWRERV